MTASLYLPLHLNTTEQSVVQIVDKEVLLDALPEIEQATSEQAWESVLDIAHGEDIEAWLNAINQYMGEMTPQQVITVSGLMHALGGLAPVEVRLVVCY